MTSITFKLPNTLRKNLEAEAKRQGRSVSNFIRHHFQEKLNPNTHDSDRKVTPKSK